MQRFPLAKRAWLLFFLIAAIVYFYGLGNFPFVGPDEPRYAQVAREMFEREEFVTPRLGGHTWFEKPALSYWVILAAYRVFGMGEWAARSGFALMGLLTVLLLYWIGTRAEGADGKEQSFLALSCGVTAATSAGLLLFSHGVNFDVPLTLAVTLALGCFLAAELKEEKRSARLRLLAAFYVGVGIALLAKGLVGVIIPFGVLAAYFIMRRAWPRREVLFSLLWGLPLALLVAATWYGPVIARNGWTFIDQFIIQHHFARFTSNKFHHPQPFYFYIPIILLFALPWTSFLVVSIMSVRRWQWRAPTALEKWKIFALAWLIVPVLFFSASSSKLPGYVLPALPGAIMLMGEQVARFLRGEGGLITTRIAGALLLLLAIASLIFIKLESYPVLACASIGASVLAAGALCALLLTNKRQLAVYALANAMLLMSVLGLTCVVKEISKQHSIAHALEQAAARGYGRAPVYQLHTIDHTAQYYAAGRLAYGADGEPLKFEGVKQVEDAARNAGDTVLVIVLSQYLGQLTDYAPLETEVIEGNVEVTLVAVRVKKNSR